MNKIHLSIVVIGGMLLFFIAIVSGYFLAKKPSILTNNTPVEEKFDSSLGVVPTVTVPDNQSSEPVLVKTVTINAKTAKTLTESNNRTGTYLEGVFTLPSGDLAYLIKHENTRSLYVNGEKRADNVSTVREVEGKLLYMTSDVLVDKATLFYGTEKLAESSLENLFLWPSAEEVDGKLTYIVGDKKLEQTSLFHGQELIITGKKKQDIKDVQKTSKGISYIIRDYSTNTDTLFHGGQAVATAYSITDYIEKDDGQLVYTTFTYVDKIPPENTIIYEDKYPTVETLFEGGKKIISADLVEIKRIAGKLAYITNPAGVGKSELFYDGKMIQSADDIDDLSLSEVAGKPAYIATDYSLQEKQLFLGDHLITKVKMDGSIQFRDIDGKLAYSIYDSSTKKSSTFYDGVQLPQNISFYSLGAILGKLYYIVENQPYKGELYYDNQKISGDYDVVGATIFKPDSNILHFTTSKETESSTIISTYKLSL